MNPFQISIPEPCSENWNAMLPQEQGRFCSSCQKIVVDFSVMSDKEIIRYFENYQGKTCGRFSNTQLGKKFAVPNKPSQWPRYFFTVLLPALFVSLKSYAQGTPVKVEQVMSKGDTIPVILGSVEKAVDHQAAIKGRVVDEMGRSLPHATVVSSDGNITTCDSTGNFQFSRILPSATLTVSAFGFETLSSIKPAAIIVLKQAQTMLSGEVVVTCVAPKKQKAVPLIQRISDTIHSKFTIFPNPAQGGSEVQIEVKALEEGQYVLSLVSAGGEIIENREVKINHRRQLIPLSVGKLPAGQYYVNLFRKKDGRSYTQKLTVQ